MTFNHLLRLILVICISRLIKSDKGIITNSLRFINYSAKTVIYIGEPSKLFLFDLDLSRNASLVLSPFYDKNKSKAHKLKGMFTKTINDKYYTFEKILDKYTFINGNKNETIYDFQFLVTSSVQSIFEASLSLSLTYDDYNYSLLHQLKKRDMINKKQFGIKIYPEFLTGSLFLGGIPSETINDMNGIVIKANESYYTWGFNFDKIQINDNIYYTDAYVYLQANIKTIKVTKDFFIYLNQTILSDYYKNSTCYLSIYSFADREIKCREKEIMFFPNIELIVQGKTLLITKSDIFQCFMEFCSLEIKISENWVLGYSFYQKYITLFDYDTKEITFYKHRDIIELGVEKFNVFKQLIILICVILFINLMLICGIKIKNFK